MPLFGADGSRFGADSYEAPIFEAEEIKESETAELPPAGVSLEEVERQSILAALTRNGGNRRLAAGQLGISERTLYRKIKEYGLE